MSVPARRKPAAAVPARSEAVVQRQAMAILKAYGVDVQRRNTRTFTVPGKGGRPRPMFCGTPGDSDLTGTLPGSGRRIDIECKREGWRPPGPHTKAYPHWARQLAQLQKVNDMGGVALWISQPEVLHDVLRHLQMGARIRFSTDGRWWVCKPQTDGG
jgi:hypothetical protein